MTETIHLKLLLVTFAGWVTRQQSHLTDYLIEENRILKEQLESSGKRLRFTDGQRRRLAAKGKHWAGISCTRSPLSMISQRRPCAAQPSRPIDSYEGILSCALAKQQNSILGRTTAIDSRSPSAPKYAVIHPLP